MSYQQGYADGVRDTKAEFLKLHKEALELQSELLDALENAIQALELYKAYGWPDRKNVIFKAKAAIAKARGEQV